MNKTPGKSKEVGTPRYLSLVVPLRKAGDEAVHKELGDRMEKVATTASNSEAEHDSGSGPRCQDTILGDVDAQTRFETTSKQSNDPPISKINTFGSEEDINATRLKLVLPVFVYAARFKLMLQESDGFAEIIDFLKASSVSYALTVNPIIYTSCIQQFWATAQVKTVNEVRQLQALIDKKKVIITEASIRNDLHLDDAEGTDCLPNTTIFEELAKMGYEKPSQKLTFYKAFFSPQWKFMIHTITQSLSAKTTAWNEFSSTMASLIICLATNRKFNLSKYIFDAMVKHLDGGVKFLMYPRFLQVFINQQLGDMSHHKKTFVNPFHTKKIFAKIKREGKDFSGRVTPLFDNMLVQASEEVGEDSIPPTDSTQIPIIDQPSTSSQPKKNKSQGGNRGRRQSGEDSMQLNDLMVLCTQLQKHVLDLEKAKSDQAIEIASLKKMVDKLEKRRHLRTTRLKKFKKLGTTRRVKSSNASLGAQEDASKQGRSIKDIDADAEISRVKKLDDTTAGGVTAAKIDELTLAQTLIEIKASKPKVVITTATTTTTTSPKARGVVVQEPSEFRTSSVAQPSMINRRRKATGSRKKSLGKKRGAKELQQESPKKQKLEDDEESDEHEQVKADYSDKLKRYLVIKKDDDIAINVIPLATKLPVIVDYKLHKEGLMNRVTTISIKISTAGTYYCLCSVSAADYKDTTAADLQLFENLLL
ncbi:hypothetical protein Tco_1575378, partial [Tanacetum coccineum]